MARTRTVALAVAFLVGTVPTAASFRVGAGTRPRVLAGRPSRVPPAPDRFRAAPDRLRAAPDDASEAEAAEPRAPFVPQGYEEMIREAAAAIRSAADAGVSRQTVRVLLPRDPQNGDLGRFYEPDASGGQASAGLRDAVLVPPDETWQGGIMQLFRSASPTTTGILRRVSRDTAGVPPKVVEDRSVDESGVDGVSLQITQSARAEDDISAFVQPTQETVETIERISKEAGSRLVLLVNPQWRNVDDALDAYSKSDGLFGNIASFLGGKGNSLRRLEELGFVNTYVIEGYVCKGGNIKLVKRFDTDWFVFAEKDDGTGYVECGSSVNRPTYQDCDKMLDDMGISLKYARDIGLAPKL